MSAIGTNEPMFYLVPISSTTANTLSNITVTISDAAEETEPEASEVMWEGVLGIEGLATGDRRYLMPGEISERDLPLTLMAQTVTAEGHEGAEVAGKITEVWREPREDLGENAVAIMGRGFFDAGDAGQEAARMVEDEVLRGVSLDLGITEASMLDPETLEPVESEDFDLIALLTGDFITAIKGEILGATLCAFPAFRDATVAVVTASGKISMESAFGMKVIRPQALTAAATQAPLKPPSEWFDDPRLNELTPLQITKEGQVYGHLADWDGCHTGFQGICIPPFRSASNYAFFNVGEIETGDGKLIPCGKIMFCRDGTQHAPTNKPMTAAEVSKYYDDSTKVGAFVRAGSDRYGTWLAGALRADLDDLEVQHLRTHPPSGDWRPVKHTTELVAAFSVPIPGFPIPRGEALVASAGGEITAIITAPLDITPDELGHRKRKRRKQMLYSRLQTALGVKPSVREQIRKDAMEFAWEEVDWIEAEGGPKHWFADITAEERRKAARGGAALPDGSFPIRDCTEAEKAIHAQGRAKDQDRVVAHIRKRVRALGCSGDIFDKYH